ncbi:DUF421 domain-containing protein [Sediminibacillus halophilus]|uniref:Uncharacterized membrane protein YcaP, DUF421 family n=1 Tax=Sediminibacillus halophilus TaxID=482461 RepID=A0A1G9TEQ1_9BACI|nr:DUF421 domain-containing protein [Sediminibacillus halophilus]SDM46113.1 Uncharacterized membrane protein YcaP, DUF421 family [Sediminibacillus halophilus]
MADFFKDALLVLFRIATILPLLLIITLFMGKRAIGELPVFDFLIVLTIGAVVGADIADPGIEHLPTVVAILGIAVLQRLVAKWKLSSRKFGKLVTFEPTIVIQDGKLLRGNMKKIHYSIDNVLQMLREKNVFDISEVETAVIEANGSLSVLKQSQKNTVTREDMGFSRQIASIAYPVVMEGKIYHSVLEKFQVDQDWLLNQLAAQNIPGPESVFLATINHQLQLHISLKEEETSKLQPIIH